MTSITLRMDDELAHDIHRLTKFLKKPKSEVIRECVRAFIQSVKNKDSQRPYEVYHTLYGDIPTLKPNSSTRKKEKILTYLKNKKSTGRL